MAYKVIFNKRFAKKIVKISEYPEEKWSVNVAKEFLAKIDDKINSISENPDRIYYAEW